MLRLTKLQVIPQHLYYIACPPEGGGGVVPLGNHYNTLFQYPPTMHRTRNPSYRAISQSVGELTCCYSSIAME
jgi:hypothetical protein